MNVQRTLFLILALAAGTLLVTPNSASAQFAGGGCGCGSSAASYGGCGTGCGDDLWAGWCNNDCNSCDTGCGRRFGLFRGFRLGAGCCTPGDPMGWDLNPNCGGCGMNDCGGCGRRRLFGRCGCGSGWASNDGLNCGRCRRFRLFGGRRCGGNECGTSCNTSCCDSGCNGCGRCGRLGLFSGRFRLRCGNFRLFNNPRCDSGYTGCNADTCGCLGESFYQDSHIDGHMYHDHAPMQDAYPQQQMIPGGQYDALPNNVQPYEGEIQPNQLQPVPSNEGNAPQDLLPQPEGDQTTAVRYSLVRPTSFDAPTFRLPSSLNGTF